MVSGKTSKMLYKLTRLADLGYKVLYVNTTKDVRATSGGDGVSFTSHSSSLKYLSPLVTCLRAENLSDLRGAVVGADPDVIGVDEAHFFDDLRTEALEWVRRQHRHVIICGLDGDFLQRPIGQILSLVPEAEDVEKISSQCSRCIAEGSASTADYPAGFTIRLTADKDPRLPAGLDVYEPVCRYHREVHLGSHYDSAGLEIGSDASGCESAH